MKPLTGGCANGPLGILFGIVLFFTNKTKFKLFEVLGVIKSFCSVVESLPRLYASNLYLSHVIFSNVLSRWYIENTRGEDSFQFMSLNLSDISQFMSNWLGGTFLYGKLFLIKRPI